MAPKLRKKSSKVGASKQCGCLNHEQYSSGHKLSVLQTSGIKRRVTYQKLLKHKLLTRRMKYVCDACLKYADEHLILDDQVSTRRAERPRIPETDTSDDDEDDSDQLGDDSLDDTINDDIEHDGRGDEVAAGDNQDENRDVGDDHDDDEDPIEEMNVEMVSGDDEPPTVSDALLKCRDALHKATAAKNNWADFNDKEREVLSEVASVLGAVISRDIYQDSLTQLKTYEEPSEVLPWLTQRNDMLIKFLTSATNTPLNNDISKKKANALTHLIEQAIYLRNLNTITPFAFTRNVVQYSITGSKLVNWHVGASRFLYHCPAVHE